MGRRQVFKITANFISPPINNIRDALDAIRTLCEEVGAAKSVCQDLHDRLKEICMELEMIDTVGGLESEPIQTFNTTVERYYRFLDDYQAKNVIMRCLGQEKFKMEIEEINGEINKLAQIVGIAGLTVDWRYKYEVAVNDQQKSLIQVLRNVSGLTEMLIAQIEQRDALIVLQSTVEKIYAGNSKLPRDVQEAMQKAYKTVLKFCGASIDPTPSWFIEESELKYETMPFDETNLASMHKGTFQFANVVVKMVRAREGGLDAAMQREFIQEVDIWSKLKHPNVVGLLGACHVSRRPFLVCEDVAIANMADFLRAAPENEAQMWKLLLDVAKGLSHLHANHIVHGDLRLATILVTSEPKAMISEFGMGRINRRSKTKKITVRLNGPPVEGNWRWLAPECFVNTPQIESDIYGFAMMILEAFVGAPPYADVQDERDVKKLILDGQLPTRPHNMSDRVWNLIERMAEQDRKARIDIKEVVIELQHLVGTKEPPPPVANAEMVEVDHTTHTRASEDVLATPITRKISEIVVTFVPVPGGMTISDVFPSLLGLCTEMGDAKTTCVELHDRLQNVFNEFQKVEKNASLDSGSIERFSSILETYWRHLDEFKYMNSVVRLIQHGNFEKVIAAVFADVDDVIEKDGLSSLQPLFDWKQKFEIDMRRHRETLETFVSDANNVLDEMRGTRDQQDVLVVLAAEIEKIGEQTSQLPPSTQQSIRTAYIAVQTCPTVMIRAIPLWYTSANDVDFNRGRRWRGSFASVYFGTLRMHTPVVVKVIESAVTDQTTQQALVSEANKLFGLHHIHIVKMLGANHVARHPFIVMEYATYGTLKDYLARPENKNKMWQRLYEGAQGIEYLHSNKVVHADLKLNNILVSGEHKALIADFGMSQIKRQLDSYSRSMTVRLDGSVVYGALRWRAPEHVEYDPQYASDVYSYAMCILEAFTGDVPYAYVDDDNEVQSCITNGKLPSRPEEMSDDVWTMIEKMTVFDPRKRLRMPEVLVELKILAARERQTEVDSAQSCAQCLMLRKFQAKFCYNCGTPYSQIEEAEICVLVEPVGESVSSAEMTSSLSVDLIDQSSAECGEGILVAEVQDTPLSIVWAPWKKAWRVFVYVLAAVVHIYKQRYWSLLSRLRQYFGY